jgi:hypothetical protein
VALTVENRLESLEQSFEEFRAAVLRLTPLKNDWRSTVGMFKDDETLDQCVKLGREYREEQNQQF